METVTFFVRLFECLSYIWFETNDQKVNDCFSAAIDLFSTSNIIILNLSRDKHNFGHSVQIGDLSYVTLQLRAVLNNLRAHFMLSLQEYVFNRLFLDCYSCIYKRKLSEYVH